MAAPRVAQRRAARLRGAAVAESPDTVEQRRPGARQRGLLVAAVVLAAVSGVSAIGASSPSGGDLGLQDAAAAAPRRAPPPPPPAPPRPPPPRGPPAGPVILPAAPVQQAAAEPADPAAIT